MKRLKIDVAILALAASLSSPLAHAFQLGVVQGEGVQVLQSADPTAAPIDSVPNGQKIYTSDHATNGYYKVKTPSGKIGFVQGSSLSFPGAPIAPPTSQPPPSPEAMAAQDQSQGDEEVVPKKKPKSKKRKSHAEEDDGEGGRYLGLRILGGIDFFTLGNLNTIYGVTQFSNPVGFGGAFIVGVPRSTRLVFQIESISQSVSVSFATAGTFDVAVKALPVMVGPEFSLMDRNKWDINLDTLVGLSLGTGLSSTANAYAAPNVTTYSSSTLTALLKLNADYLVTKTVGLGAYLGYRYLKLSNAPATLVGNGQSVFSTDGTGVAGPLTLNMSGPVAGLEATIHF